MDVFSTAAALAGANASAPQRDSGPEVAIDGRDLTPLLANASVASPHASAGLFHWRGDVVMAVRIGEYKVHFWTEGCTSYTDPPLQSHELAPLVFHIEHD